LPNIFNKLFGGKPDNAIRKSDAAVRFKEQVKNDGIEHASFRVTQMMHQDYSLSQEIALQLVLEELEAASQGNKKSKEFVTDSGFLPSKYTGASKRKDWLGNTSELEEAQNFVRTFALYLSDDTDVSSEFLVAAVDHTMKNWFFGKYARNRFTSLGWGDESIDKLMYVLDIYEDAEFRNSARIAQAHGMADPDLGMKLKEIDDIIIHISNEEGEEKSVVAGLIQVSFRQIHGKDLHES
jgi:hypothetical protein